MNRQPLILEIEKNEFVHILLLNSWRVGRKKCLKSAWKFKPLQNDAKIYFCAQRLWDTKKIISARKFNVFRSFFYVCVFSLLLGLWQGRVSQVCLSQTWGGWEYLTILDNEWPVRHVITIDETPLSRIFLKL